MTTNREIERIILRVKDVSAREALSEILERIGDCEGDDDSATSQASNVASAIAGFRENISAASGSERQRMLDDMANMRREISGLGAQIQELRERIHALEATGETLNHIAQAKLLNEAKGQ